MILKNKKIQILCCDKFCFAHFRVKVNIFSKTMQQSLHPTVLNMHVYTVKSVEVHKSTPPTKVKVCTQFGTITPKLSVRHSILPPFHNEDILPWFLSPSFFYGSEEWQTAGIYCRDAASTECVQNHYVSFFSLIEKFQSRNMQLP